MKNFKLLIEYDGTAYHGWQRQKGVPTVQETIETVLGTMTGQSVTLIGSGRTDAGVHATGQVASFKLETGLTADVFLRGLNSLLPSDIVVRDCGAVHEAFHARYDASSKVYEYRILNRPIPSALFRRYAWHIKSSLDLVSIRAAMGCLQGRHDFAAFEAAGSPRSHSVRTVTQLTLTDRDEAGYAAFSIEADGFLRHMVRNIVGTLVDVGLARRPGQAVEEILLSGDRTQAGATAPAHGLFLRKVNYGAVRIS